MAKLHDFDRMAEIAKAEIDRDAPKLKQGLDLTADASNVSDKEMVAIVRANWNNPTFRHDLVDKESDERVVDLLLKANDVRNMDGSPMSVHQYKTQVLQPFVETGTSPYLPPPTPAAPKVSPSFDPSTPPLGAPPAATAPILDPTSAPLAQPAPAGAPEALTP